MLFSKGFIYVSYAVGGIVNNNLTWNIIRCSLIIFIYICASQENYSSLAGKDKRACAMASALIRMSNHFPSTLFERTLNPVAWRSTWDYDGLQHGMISLDYLHLCEKSMHACTHHYHNTSYTSTLVNNKKCMTKVDAYDRCARVVSTDKLISMSNTFKIHLIYLRYWIRVNKTLHCFNT